MSALKFACEFIIASAFFNEFTTSILSNLLIKYDIPKSSDVKIDIYDYRGRHLKSLIDRESDPGISQVEWNSTNDNGEKVAAGVYIYKIETRDHVISRKMILLK